MDKEEFLKYLNSKSYTDILVNYCTEKGKTIEETKSFIMVLHTMDLTRQMMRSCIETAIKYYKDKFEITTVIDTVGNEITNY